MPQTPRGTDPSDIELVEHCLGGDELAFETLYSRYQDPVYGYALRMLRNATEAEEATIAILEKVFANLATFRRTDEFRPWLYGIARNECLMHMRRSRKLRQIELARMYAEEVEKPDDAASLSEEAEIIRLQVDALEEPYRETVILAYFQGLNSRQTADVLNTNENTVRTRLARALRMLRERMDGNA